MLNKSRDGLRNLPRIQSQTRVNTAFQRKQSRDTFDRKTESNHRQLKRTHSTNVCKAVKYQHTGLLYNRKIAQVKKRREQLDDQIQHVQKQINQFKKNALGIQAKTETFRQQPTKSNFITEVIDCTSSSKVTINPNPTAQKLPTDQKSLTNQLKSTQSKLQILRKKIDEQTQRNIKIQKQINVIRKQIHTYKNLNKSLIVELEQTNSEYQRQSQCLRVIDEEICNKNVLVHKVKVINQHKKAEMIRQYDQILRELQKQLSNSNGNSLINGNEKANEKFQSQVLYLTQYNNFNKNIIIHQKQANQTHTTTINPQKYTQIPQKQSKSFYSQYSLHSHSHPQSSIPTNIQTLKQKIQQYQSQLKQIHTQTQTKNTYETIQKFAVKYQQNFDIFQYINLLNEQLLELEKQRDMLTGRRDQLLSDIGSQQGNNNLNAKQNKDNKQNQIFNIKCTLNSIATQKSKLSNLSEKYQKIFVQIKQIIRQFYEKLQINQNHNNLNLKNITNQNIIQFLVQIRNRCNDLDHKFENNEKNSINNSNSNSTPTKNNPININNNNNSNNSNNNNEMNLSQLLDNVKKQNNHQNNSRNNNYNHNHNKSANSYTININNTNTNTDPNNNNNNYIEGNNNNTKNEKIMTRQQFIKARQNLMKKKNNINNNSMSNTGTGRRPLSKR